ncbi:MAG: heavy-metal-associated domain-containing protein [Actinomycetota bacterium]|nr:heavy-metal-associated domain-containing protein [Actinomycetota bacterium]
MPDITLVVRGFAETGESERLQRALARLGFVEEVNADPAKELVAVSYEGGEAELEEIGEAVREVGYEFEPSPGAEEVAEGS